jgi:putative transcription activator
LSCAYSYEVIAKRMLSERPEAESDPFYGAWVREYASEAYAAENEKLIVALNAVTKTASQTELQRLRDIFVTCSRYELAFWEMAWNQKKD